MKVMQLFKLHGTFDTSFEHWTTYSKSLIFYASFLSDNTPMWQLSEIPIPCYMEEVTSVSG